MRTRTFRPRSLQERPRWPLRSLRSGHFLNAALILTSSLLLSSCFELFETFTLDSGGRLKYAFYTQTDVGGVADRFESALKDRTIQPARSQKGMNVNLSYDGPWMDSQSFAAAGFTASVERGEGKRNHRLVLKRSWTPEQMAKYVTLTDIQLLAVQSRKPGMYKFTVVVPGTIRSAKMTKNGTQVLRPKSARGGRSYWLLPSFQLSDMSSMEIEISFSGKMTAPPVAAMPTGCNSPDNLARVAKALSDIANSLTQSNLASKAAQLQKDVASLQQLCAQFPLGASLNGLKSWLATQAPSSSPTPQAEAAPTEPEEMPAFEEEDEDIGLSEEEEDW